MPNSPKKTNKGYHLDSNKVLGETLLTRSNNLRRKGIDAIHMALKKRKESGNAKP